MNPEAASNQSNFDLTQLQMYFHRKITNLPRIFDFHNIYQWNIHDYINLGLDYYDGMDIALHFHGHIFTIYSNLNFLFCYLYENVV